jgi:hypothetical protein
MTSPIPIHLLDTCSIINLSYCAPVASAFRSRYEGSAGWVRATQAEPVRQRCRRPPHPQAGRASNWAAMWLGIPIEIVDENLLFETESIQRNIAGGCKPFGSESACMRHSHRSTCSQAILDPGFRQLATCSALSDGIGDLEAARR